MRVAKTVLYGLLCLTLFSPAFAHAQDLATAGTVISGAQAIIADLRNIGPTWAGDFSIATGGTASQLSALLSQFQNMIGANVAAPLNTLGLDAQQLARRIQGATDQLNAILTHQRNCGFANAESLISGIRNVGLNLERNIPLVSGGTPRVDYVQFLGHDPEVIPREGGQATVFGYALYIGEPPTVSLNDSAGNSVTTLNATRAGSDDAFMVNLPALASYAGQSLLLDIHTHKKKHFLGISYGDESIELKLPFVVPQAYSLKYRVTATVNYVCTAPSSWYIAAIDYDFHNSSCEDRKNVSDVRTPDLLVPNGLNPQIVGIHFENWPDGHASPNTRNQSSVGVSYTATTVTAAGWIDTASCGPFAHLFHDTFWQARVIPEVRYTQRKEHNETANPTLVDAALPTTNASLTFPSACFEPGAKSFSYTITPIVNGQNQKDLYSSPVVTGSEHGVSDTANLGPIAVSGSWNPQPINGRSQVSVTISAPQCGH